MKVKRTIIADVRAFEVNDIISFNLKDGEHVEGMAVKAEDDGMLFVLVDCLRDEEPMNSTDTNAGGYAKSRRAAKRMLRKWNRSRAYSKKYIEEFLDYEFPK